MAPQCQALNLSDERRCTETATNVNGLFCHFHSRQVYGLYRGYKRRNAQLDHLLAHPPPFLREQDDDTPLSKVDFSAVADEATLKQLRDHLFERHALLDRVIRARKLHHSRFYALKLDYGHQHYLDSLQSQKHAALRALERVERRSAEVLYEKQKWFKWVRELEDEEEKARDAEKKKVKQEAALLKRQWKEVEARMRELRAREELRRQDEFLDKALEERRRLDDSSADEEWDPIDDVVEDERGNYIDLLRLFLWQETARGGSNADGDVDKGEEAEQAPLVNAESVAPSEDAEQAAVKAADAPKSRGAKKRAKQKVKAAGAQQAQQGQARPGETHVESQDDVRQRLREGQKMERAPGWKLRGTIENPIAIADRMPPVPDDEIDLLLSQISEIKQLLFCRLLLAHAALLPVALRANSIEEFLADEEVNNTDLRDLCLKMEQPGLQELRDACADLDRGENEEVDDDDKKVAVSSRRGHTPLVRRTLIPRSYQTKREKALMERRERSMGTMGGTMIDFGDIDDQGQYHIKKIRVKVCGKYIYNYPSEKAMSRGGWLQFSIMAKDCSLFDAVKLCRNWDEFFELSILATYQYFPSGNWAAWVGDQMRQQVLQLGFIPYFQMEMADKYTMHSQTGSRSYHGRQHQIIDARNFICACLKRNDPVSRRFIQYLVMQTNAVLTLVRDVKTGNILTKPPEFELWLIREKSGLGRASRNDWNIIKEVGPEFFEDMDRQRQWHFGFKEYYDVIIWDLEAGCHFSHLYNTVQTALIKAHRFQQGLDLYKPSEHILCTIARDKETQRTRDIKPSEEGKVVSIWDDINSDRNRVKFFTDDAEDTEDLSDDMPKEWKYNEADRLEDEILFPWENQGINLSDKAQGALKEGELTGAEDEDSILATQGRMHKFETLGPVLERFAYDLDTDEEISDVECNSDCGSDCEHEQEEHGWYDEDEDFDFDDDDEEWDGEGVQKYDPDYELDDGSSPADRLIKKFGLPAADEFATEEDRFKAAAQAVGFPGATSWDELWSNVRETRPATADDYADLKAVIVELYPARKLKAFGKSGCESTDSSEAANKKAKKEKKPSRAQQKEEAFEEVSKDWEIHLDRERFKDCWHKADLEPGAQGRWTEYTKLMADLEKWETSKTGGRGTTAAMIKRATYGTKLMVELGVDGDVHRRVKRDMSLACTLTSLFFGNNTAFFNSETGLSFKSSLLVNQAERAKHPPDRRSPHSNKTRPKEHWKEWDAMSKTHSGDRHTIESYPEDWNLIVRPTLAHFYREGVICTSYSQPHAKLIAPPANATHRYYPSANGPVICLTEPDRPGKPDVYFDWRLSVSEVRLPSALVDPHSIDPLAAHARRFAKDNPGARFSVLKIWSAPHFWPLMLGYDNRDNTSFTDGLGRTWEWKFIPKDMPFSEWSIHQTARTRMEPYRRFFKKQVVCKKDAFLVMGKDEAECERLTTAAVWAVNTRPWRLEVDPWKSWWGVDVGFLDGLEAAWWE
uniref:Mfs allantoate n=1 Tax=Neofusicoccum kwambonambiense TaxID=643001 RepID=A0A343JZX9_9PEZI|nr:mfs allantoate [Neofusicoccum kwambonambiense]